MDNTKDTPETAPETVTSNEADVVKANDAESSQSGEPNESSEAKKLGELLLSYREKVGMDLDQAADAMCLTRGTLEALENEDFHLLPEAPYIRGYLRGYAKLAGVSSAEAVALYESIRGGDPLMQTPYHFTPSAKDDNLATQGLSSSLWKVIGAVLLAVLLIGLWTIPEVKSWVSETWAEFSQKNTSNLAESEDNSDSEDESNGNSSKDEQVSPETAKNTTIPESELVGKIRRDGDVPDLAQNDKVSPDDPDANQSASAKSNKDDDKSANADDKRDDDKQNTENPSENAENKSENDDKPSDDNASDEQAKKEENNSNNTDTTATEENSEANNSETEGDTIAVDLSDVDTKAGEVAIKLVFEAEVWMRIKKKGGKQVFAGLRKKGEVHEMKAVKPLKFKVGNAPGVKIYINGKLFDQKPYQRGVVSRFEVE